MTKPCFQLKDCLEAFSAPFPSDHVVVLPRSVAELFSKVRTAHCENFCLFTFLIPHTVLIPHLRGILQHSRALTEGDE